MLFSRRLMLGLAIAGTLAGALAVPALAEGPTEIDLFFPVPVDGKLARDMGTLIKEFNEGHPAIKATAVYTGSYDDTLAGVMMPFFASAFGTFLMRQAFEAIPTELEDAALIDGASLFQRIRHIYVPLSLPSFSAFAIISVTSHWNDFLWPLMVIAPLLVTFLIFQKLFISSFVTSGIK